jgi:hypothetical protein
MERISVSWISYVLFARKSRAQSSDKAAQRQLSRKVSKRNGDASRETFLDF